MQVHINSSDTRCSPFAAAFPVERPAHWAALWRAATRGKTLANEGSTARDALAAERTFLAWVRTAISLVAVGMVLSKTSLFLAEQLEPQAILISEVLGSALVGLGVAVVVAGYWRQLTISVALEQGKFPLSTRISSLLFLCAFAGMASCFLFVTSTMHDQESAALASAGKGSHTREHNKD